MTDTSDLEKSIGIKASMIEHGDRILWGSDAAIMREAADALAAKDAEISRLKEEIEILKQWKPIAEAPKDGTYVLVWSAEGGVEIAHWSIASIYDGDGDEDKKAWTTPEEGPGYWHEIEDASHFMPLPPPPQGKRE